MKLKDKIIIHRSESPDSRNDIGFEDINEWHRARGFRSLNPDTGQFVYCGYHIIVRRDKRIELGRSFNQNGAHTLGENARSIGVVYIGMTPNKWQLEVGIPKALDMAKKFICSQDGYPFDGKVQIGGHRDYQKMKKVNGVEVENICPNFDVREVYGKEW